MDVEIAAIIPIAEDVFGFSIPSEDAAGLADLDALHQYILARRFRGYQEDCLARVTAYKLKRGMMRTLQIPRERIRESTELAELIPRHRRRVWRLLQHECGLRLPELTRPAWVKRIIAAATAALGIAVPVLLGLPLLGGAIIAALLAMIVLGYLFALLTKPLAFCFHSDCRSMDQLALLALALNYPLVARELNASISGEEVRRRLFAAVARHFSIPPGQLADVPEKRDYRHAV